MERIIITTSSEVQKVYTRVTEGSAIRKKYFNAFIKFEDGNKVFLKSKKLKKSLLKYVHKLNEQLGLEITDYSE